MAQMMNSCLEVVNFTENQLINFDQQDVLMIIVQVVLFLLFYTRAKTCSLLGLFSNLLKQQTNCSETLTYCFEKKKKFKN